MDGKSRSSKRRGNRRKSRRASLAKLDTTSAGLGEAAVKGAPVAVDLTLSPSQQKKQYLGEEAQGWLDRLRAEGEGMLDRTDSDDEGSEDFSGDETKAEVERSETTKEEEKNEQEAMMEERRKKNLLEDADQEDLRRSEGEGMLYHAATLEDELTPMGERQLAEAEAPAPQKMDESAARAREALRRDEEDLRRSEGEGMLYDAATLEEEQAPRPGKFDTQAEKRAGERLGAPAEATRESERERESEIEKERRESEEVETKRESESEEEAYERLKREAEEEEKERAFQEEEAKRLRQEEEEAEALRLKMAHDWEELERQRAEAQAEEERKSRERVEELMRAAEEEEKRKQREMKEAMREREATEKLRREREIDQLVTRQSLDIENRRDELRRTSAQRMGPVKWVPDHLVSACQSCQEPFTLTKRRHHCRACGKVFCAKCSSKESRVRWYEEAERVCDTCFLHLKGNLENKVVLMSGANSGVAAEVAEEMARQGATLAILSPDAEEASALAQRIKKVTGNTEVMPLWADFASLDSVYEAVERFRRQFERVDVLINNCDIDPRNGREVHALTHDGNEKLFSLKYLSHFMVTYLLLDLLKLSAPSRVINVCPRPTKHAHINFDDLGMEKRWSDTRATEQSHLAIYCMTRELGLRLKGSGVAVNVLDLGHVYTSDQSILSRAWCHINGDTRDDEAKNAYMYMAASPLTQEVSRGCFLPDGSPTLFRGRTLDDAFCSRVYHVSYDLVAKWVARDDRAGMMEGRMMESALTERIREATRESEEVREQRENERLEIDVGSDLEESSATADDERRRKGKSKLDVGRSSAIDEKPPQYEEVVVGTQEKGI